MSFERVQGAIEESICQSRTVSLVSVRDTDEWVQLARYLSSRCSNYVEEIAGPGAVGVSRLYWGTSGGDGWKVRLIGTGTKNTGHALARGHSQPRNS